MLHDCTSFSTTNQHRTRFLILTPWTATGGEKLTRLAFSRVQFQVWAAHTRKWSHLYCFYILRVKKSLNKNEHQSYNDIKQNWLSGKCDELNKKNNLAVVSAVYECFILCFDTKVLDLWHFAEKNPTVSRYQPPVANKKWLL